jgi:hypothetical protein
VSPMKPIVITVTVRNRVLVGGAKMALVHRLFIARLAKIAGITLTRGPISLPRTARGIGVVTIRQFADVDAPRHPRMPRHRITVRQLADGFSHAAWHPRMLLSQRGASKEAEADKDGANECAHWSSPVDVV